MKKRIIELDVDGVLADMDGSYAPYIKDIISDFSEEKHILEWNMPDFSKKYPEAAQIIKSLWVNPEFIYNLPRYPGVVEGLQYLNNNCKDLMDIITHTHIFDKGSVYDSRRQWLDDLRNDSGVDFDINIATGIVKDTFKYSSFIVEDNIQNLYKSPAPNKFLVRRGHNRNYGVNDIGTYLRGFVVNDFYESAYKIVEILKAGG